MKYSATALASSIAGIALISRAQGFKPSVAFTRPAIRATSVRSGACAPGCTCPACIGVSCACANCARTQTSAVARLATHLFADATETEVEIDDTPAEVAAMDGVESADEAHNVDRPARNSLKKKSPQNGKALSEFSVGDTMKASVKSITDYGCFCDFGAVSQGLVHVSRMSKGFVKDVREVVSEGDEVEVRIVEINEKKGQIALSFLTEDEEQEAGEQQRRPRQNQQRQRRRSDSAVLDAVEDKGYDSEVFLPGTVVSTVAFGAFVRVDAKSINDELEGAFDGLVHISCLAKGRTSSVNDVVNVNDSVKVRIKSMGGGKVALSMLSVEDEAEQQERGGGMGGGQVYMGDKDWKESLENMKKEMPEFRNGPKLVERN